MKFWRIIIFFCLTCLLPNVAFAVEGLPRGLFVTVLQDPPVLSNAKDIRGLVAFAKKAHINTLFVQVYRAGQAWFPSSVGDQSPYNEALKGIGEDPFALLIQSAHAQGIEVHAWLNLLSLGKNNRSPLLKKYGAEILTRNLVKKKSLADYRIDSQYFLEPGDLRVRDELSTLVGDLLTAYPDLDGIQFDYIRYPDKNPAYGYAPMNVDRFKKATGLATIEEGSQIWNDWKRAQVTECLEQLVKKARSIRPHIQVSTTGCMSYIRAYEEAFQDWPSWISRGLVDFVTTMSYTTSPDEFGKYILEAISKSSDFKKVNTAIGAYELTEAPKIFAEQLHLCEAANGKGCVIFHYGSLVTAPELANSLTDSAARAETQSP